MTKLSNIKATIYGSYLKIQETDRLFSYNHKNLSKKDKSKTNTLADPETSARKSKALCKDIVRANAYQYRNKKGNVIPLFFATFTFAENITDLKVANKYFRSMIKKLCYKTGESIKYLAVPEYQKRGAVHYHVLFFNLPYLENIFETLSNLWGQGFILNKTVNDLNQATNYLTKYIQKEINVKHAKHSKRFLTSKGLKKRIITREKEQIQELISVLPKYTTLTECDYVGSDGTKFHQTDIQFPPDTNLPELFENMPQDTYRLAKKIFGVK
jgi:hypothetical protein